MLNEEHGKVHMVAGAAGYTEGVAELALDTWIDPGTILTP